jgi:RNA 2',3'-cyclic 3'-phosphodiesterase
VCVRGPRYRCGVQPPNWFIALPLAAALPALTPPAGVRLFAPEDLHLTVAFLGGVSEAGALRAFELTRELTLCALEVRLSNVVALGPAARPSAFSALLSEGRATVEQAISALRPQLWAAAGARVDTRPALAHVTLARPVRRATPEQLEAACAWASALQLGEARARLERVALYTWSRDRSQTLFRIVHEMPLMAAV